MPRSCAGKCAASRDHALSAAIIQLEQCTRAPAETGTVRRQARGEVGFRRHFKNESHAAWMCVEKWCVTCLAELACVRGVRTLLKQRWPWGLGSLGAHPKSYVASTDFTFHKVSERFRAWSSPAFPVCTRSVKSWFLKMCSRVCECVYACACVLCISVCVRMTFPGMSHTK